jgi:hypothetical protein
VIIINPISALLYFVSLGIDIIIFFLAVRFILLLRSFSLLAAFDKAGDKLVNATTETASRLIARLFNKTLSEKGLIVASILALTLIDLVLVWISKSFV